MSGPYSHECEGSGHTVPRPFLAEQTASEPPMRRCLHCQGTPTNMATHLRDTGGAKVRPDDACPVLWTKRSNKP